MYNQTVYKGKHTCCTKKEKFRWKYIIKKALNDESIYENKSFLDITV